MFVKQNQQWFKQVMSWSFKFFSNTTKLYL